jgi:hypothetical protein
MSKLRTVLVHDFDALLKQRVGLALTLLVPLMVLLLLGRQSTMPPVRVLVAGAPRTAGVQPDIDRLVVVLKESAGLAVSTEPKAAADPLLQLEHGRFDLLLNYESKNAKELSIYTAETDPAKLSRLEKIGAGILRASAVIDSRLTAENGQRQEEAQFQAFQKSLPDPKPDLANLHSVLFAAPRWKPLFDEVWWAKPALYEDLFMLGTFPVDPLFEYYPQAADPQVNALPATLAVILGLFPFLLMLAHGRAGSSPLEISTWRDAAALALGRSIVAGGITLVSFMLLLIAAESLHGVLIKAGIFRIMLLLLPALMASAFLGLSLSRLVRSPLSVAAISMAYLILIILLGGSETPLAERPLLAQQLGSALPSTFVQPALAGWIFGAQLDWTMLRPVGGLLLQALLYGALAIFALLRPVSGEDREAETESRTPPSKNPAVLATAWAPAAIQEPPAATHFP